MLIRSLGIFFLLLIQCVKSFDEEDNIQLANMIDYIITIDVFNREHFGLGGMVVSIKYGQQLIADKEITDAKGQFIKKGKWAQSSSYNVEIDVGTQYDNNSRHQSLQGNILNGVVTIQGKITFDSSDFQNNDPQRKCQIQVNTFVVGSTQKLPDVNINFSIGYNSNNIMNFIKFSGISDQNGYLITRFWIPTQVAVVFYESGKNGYWNDVQNDPNNQKFILFAQNKYSLSFDSMISSGIYKYILKGRAIDEKTSKGLEGVDVVLGGKNMILNQEISEKKFKTKSDGIFLIEQDLQIYHQYQLIWHLNKDKYQEQAKRYEFDIDLDKKDNSETTNDIGTVKMLQALGQLTISGTISDSSKILKQVEDATIELSLGENSQPHQTKTDKNGQYQLQIHTPIDEKIIIQISVQAKGFVKKMSDKKEITVYENKPATLSINVELDRVKVPIKINDKIIDEKTNQVVPETKVKIISSDPQIKDSTYYNQEVKDNSDGTVQLNFECYENVNFKATLQYQVPLYVPYTYTTPSLECKNQDLGSTPIKLAKMTAIMNLKGDVKDINSKTVKDFQFTISSEPSLQFPNDKIKSGSDGSWSIEKITIIPETTYQLHATYINIVKDNTVVTFKYVATIDKIQNVKFPTINVEALVKATIGGTISTPEGPIQFPIPIQIKCDSKGKDGKPIIIQTKCGSDGKFSQQVEMVGAQNVEDVCHVTSGTTQSVKPFDQQVKVAYPKWEADSKVSTTYNSFDVTMSGKVTDKSGMSKSMEGVEIILTLTPMDPLIPAQKTHMLELFLKKQQFLDQKTSQLSTKSSKDGTYKLSFKVVQGIELTGELTASMKEFDKFDKKGIKISASKSETITQDIELNRETFTINLHSTLLDSNNKPVPKATIAIGKTNPLIKDSPSYDKPVKDQDNGNFAIQLNCYKEIEYVATFKVNVPTFMEQSLDSSKFKCSQKDIQLSPLKIKLEKVVLMAIISGKVLNPYGKGQSNLDLKFLTKPDSAQLSTKTAADGTWTINDPKIVPNQQYQADVTYQDYNKKQQEVEQKFEIQSANQKITFKDIMYSDTVKAKIEGTIKVEKGTITSPVTMELVCPKTQNQLKETKLEFKSDKAGKISESFDIVATFKEIIKCQITPKDVIESKPITVELQQPKYEAQIQIQGKLQSQKVTISGMLKDHAKISSALPNVLVTLTLKPEDQLADSLQTKSGQDSKYKLEFEILKGQEYEATLTVDDPPQFKKNIQTFKISGKTDQIAITKDFDLERIIVDCQIVSSLQGSWNPEAQVEITSSIPLMDNKVLYNKPVTTSQGAFSIPFQCYQSRQTTLEMDMWSVVYPKTSLPPQDFECGPKTVKLKPIQVKSDSVQITLSGIVTDKTKIVTGVPLVEVALELTPKDPLASSLKTKTDENGKYSLLFGAVKNFSYKMIVKFTNPGFQEYKSQQITVDTSKSNQINQNAELDRIIMNPTVHVTLNDDQSKPLNAPLVTVSSLYPTVKGHESDKISGNGDNKGQVALKLFCYKEVDETMVLDVQVPKFRDAKTNSLAFKCDKTDITVPPTKVKLEKAPTATFLTINGQIINPDGKGQKNVNIRVTTTPQTEELTSTTGSDGKYTIKSNGKLLLKTKYNLLFQYDNADGSKNEVKHEFQTEKEISSLDMGQMNFADFRRITISGVMQTSSDVPAGLTSIQASSATISKDKNPLQTETLTDQQGRFNLQFDLLVELKKTVKVLLQNEASGRYTSQKTEIDIIPPKYEYSNQKVIVKATQEYQDQLDQYYKQLEVNGQVIGQFNCNNNQKTLGIEGVQIIVKQWNGLSYNDMNIDIKSDQNGYYKFATTILKSKLPNEIQMEFVKDNYINKLIYLNAYNFQGDTENKIVASLPPTQMTYLNGLAPCPKNK